MHPLKQGLKLLPAASGLRIYAAFIHESIKTRVETSSISKSLHSLSLHLSMNPSKQGLKHKATAPNTEPAGESLPMNPSKQGLKASPKKELRFPRALRIILIFVAVYLIITNLRVWLLDCVLSLYK